MVAHAPTTARRPGPSALAVAVGCLLVTAMACGGENIPTTSHTGEHFEIQVPQGWEPDQDRPDSGTGEGDDAEEDSGGSLEITDFRHPDDEHRLLVNHWRGDAVSASDYARGNENSYRDEYGDYERIDLRREDPADYPEGWDVAYLEMELDSDNWERTRRRVTELWVSIGDHRLGELTPDAENYQIQFNVPADEADDYEALRAEIFASFEVR